MEWLGLLNYAVFMAIFIGIYAILALGLNVQWGLTGLFNAGIAGFFAVGAYTSAIITGPAAEGRLGGFEAPVAVGWLGAMVVAGLIACPIGKITLRFRSDYLAIAPIPVPAHIPLVAHPGDGPTPSNTAPTPPPSSPARRPKGGSAASKHRWRWAGSAPWWWPASSPGRSARSPCASAPTISPSPPSASPRSSAWSPSRRTG